MRVDETAGGATGQRTDEWTASPWWRRVGWVLVASWALVVVLVPMTGEKESTYGTLVGDLVDGVSVVEVESASPELDGEGYRTVWVHWSSDGIDRVAEVVDASSPREARRARRDMQWLETGTHIQVGLVEALQKWNPEAVVETRQQRAGTHGTITSWRTSPWLAGVALLLALVTLGLVVSGPPPRRANRWAWFWMLVLSPLGLALFLAFGGPAGRRDPPPVGTPYMRGGWGFLAAVVLGAFWSWTRR